MPPFDALGICCAIIERFAEAGFDSVVNGRQLVTEPRAIGAAWSDSITRRQAIGWRALDIVFHHPVLHNALVQREPDAFADCAGRRVT